MDYSSAKMLDLKTATDEDLVAAIRVLESYNDAKGVRDIKKQIKLRHMAKMCEKIMLQVGYSVEKNYKRASVTRCG